MGLDMYINKIKRFKNATLKDVYAVDSMISLIDYRKRHPEYKGSFSDWCGQDEEPSQEMMDFYSAQIKDDEYGYPHCYEQVAYWRKANAIHNWFVKHVQGGEDDCDVHREITAEDLLSLCNLCMIVKKEPKMAKTLLPTRSGFFFGDTEYDDWYMEDIDNTIEQIEKILEETDFSTEALYYVSSW